MEEEEVKPIVMENYDFEYGDISKLKNFGFFELSIFRQKDQEQRLLQ